MAACGLHHSVVVSAEGRAWTFGSGDFGRLGHNDEQDGLVPTLLAAEVFEDHVCSQVRGKRGILLAHYASL